MRDKCAPCSLRPAVTHVLSPVIAIIGRPNVGKSTLFNRLTGKRAALVSDMPGLTRDRREGEAELAGNPVTIVDTAGLEEAKRGSIAERMRQQTEAALAAADLVLFVIDAREGVTPADKIVRASSCAPRAARSSLVANKCEGRAGEEGFYAAFELGFGEPVAISAEHGEGLGDLVDRHAGGARASSRSHSDETRRGGDATDAEATVAADPRRHRRPPQRRQVDAGQRASSARSA